MPGGLIPDFKKDKPVVLGQRMKSVLPPRRTGRRGGAREPGIGSDKPAPKGAQPVVPELDKLKVHPYTSDSFMCWNEIDHGHSNQGELAMFRKEMGGLKNLLDVGAMHGFFSFLFTHGRPDTKCLAVDPSRAAIEYLNYNIKVNKMKDQFIVEEKALSNKVGKLKMTDDPQWKNDHVRHAGVTDEGIDSWEGDGTPRDYKCITGDELCKEHNFIPDFIKIDVEGHETKVLEGCRELIAKHRPTIFCEIHAGTGFLATEGGELNVFRQILEPLDYDIIFAAGGHGNTENLHKYKHTWEGYKSGDHMKWTDLNIMQQQMETRFWHIYSIIREKYVPHDELVDVRIIFRPQTTKYVIPNGN